MRPVWLCPLRLRRGADGSGDRPWPGYPLSAATTYVNVGFWGIVNVGPDAPTSPRNRAIEAKVSELGGHKSLYSEAFYAQRGVRPPLRRGPPGPREGRSTIPTADSRPSTTRWCDDDDLPHGPGLGTPPTDRA